MFVKKSDGKVALIYNPGSVTTPTNTSSVTQVLTFVTQTTKFSSATIAVRAKRTPSTILGLSSDAAKGAVKGRNLTIEAGDIRFQDQFGNSMSAKEVAASVESGMKYFVKVTLLDADNFEAQATSSTPYTTEIVEITKDSDKVIKLKAKSSGDSGSSKVKLELHKAANTSSVNDNTKVKSSEDKNIELYAASLKDMSNFSIEDPGLVAASNVDDASAKGFKPSVVGYYLGQKIDLVAEANAPSPAAPTDNDDFVVFGAKKAAVGGVDTDLLYAPVPEIDKNIKNTVVEKAKVRVIIKDNKGTEVEREFSYSNEARKVSKVTSKDVIDVDANAKGWDTAGNAINDKFTVKDQYDTESSEKPYITYSEYDKSKVTVANNGTKYATIQVNATGEYAVTVKLTFPKTSYVFEKVIIFKRS